MTIDISYEEFLKLNYSMLNLDNEIIKSIYTDPEGVIDSNVLVHATFIEYEEDKDNFIYSWRNLVNPYLTWNDLTEENKQRLIFLQMEVFKYDKYQIEKWNFICEDLQNIIKLKQL